MKESKEIIDRRLKQINIQIGDNITKARLAAGVSGEELSKKIGVTQQQLFKYESGKNATPPGRLVLIAEALKIDLLSLFNNTFNDSNTPNTKIRKILCAATSRDFIKIQDVNDQRAIHKIIKKTLDNQK